jgi:hypothetical protein
LIIAAAAGAALLVQANEMAASAAGWSVVSSPNAFSNGYNVLDGVAAVSATDAWAVGFSRVRSSAARPFRPLIERWDGSAWQLALSAALPAADDARLHAVTAVSPADVWAVGEHTTGTAKHSLTEHWDGVRWSVVSPPAAEPLGATLLGAAANGATDVWAVGRQDNADGTFQTLAEHWDGSRWSVTPTPTVTGLNRNALFGVVALSRTDAWAVGQLESQHPAPVIEHWDGAAWTIHSSPPTPFYGNLQGISAVSASDIWAVGFQGVVSTLAEHWDGTNWSVVATPSAPGGNSSLSSVAAISTKDVWAVGLVITGGSQKTTLAEHWDGQQWSTVSTPSPGPLANVLAGVAGTSGGPLWATGSRQSQNATTTLVLRTTA